MTGIRLPGEAQRGIAQHWDETATALWLLSILFPTSVLQQLMTFCLTCSSNAHLFQYLPSVLLFSRCLSLASTISFWLIMATNPQHFSLTHFRVEPSATTGANQHQLIIPLTPPHPRIPISLLSDYRFPVLTHAPSPLGVPNSITIPHAIKHQSRSLASNWSIFFSSLLYQKVASFVPFNDQIFLPSAPFHSVSVRSSHYFSSAFLVVNSMVLHLPPIIHPSYSNHSDICKTNIHRYFLSSCFPELQDRAQIPQSTLWADDLAPIPLPA